jgi:hypothetical protein
MLTALFLGACSQAYYGAWEKMGWHKRDILVERVEEARDDQQEAKEQFASALERFRSVVQVDGGQLEAKYNELRTSQERSEASAAAVTSRINAVEEVAKALFEEWKSELDQYESASLRNASEQQLRRTQERYDKLIAAMRKAESSMKPVLSTLRDQVLFLKHNLNAQAIASLSPVASDLENEVGRLIKEMEQAINEADAFIKTIQPEQ